MFRGGDVLLVQRGKGIYRGAWSLPGGAVELGETALEAAKRELLGRDGTACFGPDFKRCCGRYP